MASNETPKCILLRGDPIYGEGLATAAITPGMMVAVAGGAATMAGAASVGLAAATALAMTVARENEVIGDGIDDAYASGDTVLFMNLRKGDWFYGLVPAAEAAVSAGDTLEPAGDGTFTAVNAGTPVVKALEAVDNSGGGSPARIKLEVL